MVFECVLRFRTANPEANRLVKETDTVMVAIEIAYDAVDQGN